MLHTASAYYGFTPILIPFNQPHDVVISLLKEAQADVLVGQAGSLPFEDVVKSGVSLRQVIWVVEKTSRHVDWTEVPADVGGKTEVSVWHDVAQDHGNGTPSLPSETPGGKLSGIVSVWQSKAGDKNAEVTEFTQQVRDLMRQIMYKLITS